MLAFLEAATPEQRRVIDWSVKGFKADHSDWGKGVVLAG